MEIIAQNISFGYKGAEYLLFHRLSFCIKSPGFYSLFGFSGCGKSTLARIVAGLINPNEGSIKRDKVDTILLCYNTERLPGWLSIGHHLKNVKASQVPMGDLEFFIDQLGLSPFLAKKFFRLSMGQKNRANLARYLVQDFDMLICDEVLANVDEPSRNHILSVIKKRFCNNRIIFYISHNVEEVCFFSKKIFIIPGKAFEAKRLIEIQGIDGTERQRDSDTADLLKDTILKVLMAASTPQGRAQ